MRKRIITISREFGSGGHEIGKRVAEKLSIPFYDKEILEEIAEKTGLSKAVIEKQGEYSPGKNIFSYAFVGRDPAGNSVSDQIFYAQTQTIKQLAKEGDCIIIGRCADYILQNEAEARHIFIHGNENIKQKRIETIYGISPEEARKRMREIDKKRKIHYNYYTEQEWGSAKNYSMTLNSSVLGMEKCVELISCL